MEKFSVKKPYTILVAVIIVLALGVVSVTRMSTELLPDFSLPYMLVITTYVGASPETVEAGVTEPLESELGTISGVKNVYSYSMENYSLIQLEYEEDTDMDSALVKLSSAINEIEGSLPDMAGTPIIMELSMDMVATMYIGVGYEGYDQYRLTDYVSDEVIPYLERQNGVASVSSVGLVEETVVVELNQAKIDDLNDEILITVNAELADAKAALNDAQAQIDEALDALEDSPGTAAEAISSGVFDALTPTAESVSGDVTDEIASLQEQIDTLREALEYLQDADLSDAEAKMISVADEALESISDLLSDMVLSLESAAESAASSAVSISLSSLASDISSIVSEAVWDMLEITEETGAQTAWNATSASTEALIASLSSSLSRMFTDTLREDLEEELSSSIISYVSQQTGLSEQSLSSAEVSSSSSQEASFPSADEDSRSRPAEEQRSSQANMSSFQDGETTSRMMQESGSSLTDMSYSAGGKTSSHMMQESGSSLTNLSYSLNGKTDSRVTVERLSSVTDASPAPDGETGSRMMQENLSALTDASSFLDEETRSRLTEENLSSMTGEELDGLQQDIREQFAEEVQSVDLTQISDLAESVYLILANAALDSISAAVYSLSDSLTAQQLSALTESLTDNMIASVSDAVALLIATASSSLNDWASDFAEEAASSDAAALARSAADWADDAIASADEMADETLDSLLEKIDELSSQLDSISSSSGDISSVMDSLESLYASLTEAQLTAAVELAVYTVQMTEAQATLEEAQAAYDEQREIALASANLNDLLTMETLSALIYAQNFSMPAGYIDDEDDNTWLLKIGDEYDNADDLAEVLLVDNDATGIIRLSDIADITVIDNADESYATLNGDDGIVLMIYKSSAYGTNEVSSACNEALEDLAAEDPNFEYMILMDQGSYIDMIVESVLMSMILGGILAVIILALFLKDVKPTIVVAISIPLSVLLALVLMYFTGLELNIMTLSGLALGIGMLVDNSIVVLENILRLRNSGLSAPRAAVQGARQVRSAIIASTLTTICVFLPVVFTDGTVRTLLMPLALSIGYCLVASLLIALTVVPAATSTIFRDIRPKRFKTMERIQDQYERSLRWCLKHKAIPLGIAISLFVITVYAITQTGIIFFPDITTTAVEVTITTRETDTREESYSKVGEIAEIIMGIDGAESVGIMSSDSATSMMGISLSSGDDSYGSYMCYVTIPEDTSQKKAQAICDAIAEATASVDADIEVSSSSMSDMTSLLMSSGLTVNIYGEDLDTLQEISDDIQVIIAEVEGFDNASDGTEESEATLHLVIDKDAAMSYGLTVAQIYAQAASALTTSAVSTTVWVDGVELDVEIVDETDMLMVENLLDMEFDVSDAVSTDVSASYDFSALAMDTEDDGEEPEETAGEAAEDDEEDDGTITLGEIAYLETTTSLSEIDRKNQTRLLSVTADVLDGYNTTLLSRELKPLLEEYEETLPYGYSIELSGETSQISEMVTQIIEMAILGFLFIYLIMVAEFQSLKSPFIVIFTIPLAFTGGMLGLLISGQQLSILSMIGFIVLMGTVVNNGIVFVDYTNQLRLGGLRRRDALCAAGRTRMRPIVMTALTTILALSRMIVGTDMASQLGSGMSIVIAGGLLYATFMTLYIIPTIYDIFFKRRPLNIDIGDDLDDVPDDAAEYLRQHRASTRR